MALSLISCAAASAGSDVPALAVFLTVLFGSYIALDSLLAAVVVVRKATEAEAVSARMVA